MDEVYDMDNLHVYLEQEPSARAGELSDDVIDLAKMLYDLARMPTFLANTLARTAAELRRALGEVIRLECPQCGYKGWALEERNRGGIERFDYACPKCRSLMSRRI